MPSAFSSKLNTTLYSGLQRALTGKQAGITNSEYLLPGEGKFFVTNFGLSVFVPFSTWFLSGTHRLLTKKESQGKAMATSGSFFSGNFVDFGAFFSDKGKKNCEKGGLRLKRQETGHQLCQQFSLILTNRNINFLIGLWPKNVHTLSFSCNAAGAARDVFFDGNSHDEQIANPPTPSDQTSVGERPLKLISGSWYLPHPDKEKTGGEDAHFICEDKQAVGVADGVGGWADVGVDAGQYARELMSNSVAAIQQDPRGSVDPASVLEKAHSSTKAKGSSTACIITLTDDSLHAINLGDSGFIVVRDGYTVFQSPPQQHGFNFPYQLDSDSAGDPPSSGQIYKVAVSPGDVIVAGTDGLFDNVFSNEVAAVVADAVKDGLSPQATAQKIAALARQHALDRTGRTPFAAAAQNVGFTYYGGKLDDITVVVSYVTGSASS